VGLDRSESALRTALGASRTGKTEAAREDVQQLASIRDTLILGNDKYWADQVDIQRESAAAWITLAEGKGEEALRQMRSAAEHEDSTDKHNVTPGVIPPARELLGEMLLELKQPAQAMVEFEATLRTAPNRFRCSRFPCPDLSGLVPETAFSLQKTKRRIGVRKHWRRDRRRVRQNQCWSDGHTRTDIR
jgi:hypothetical protein